MPAGTLGSLNSLPVYRISGNAFGSLSNLNNGCWIINGENNGNGPNLGNNIWLGNCYNVNNGCWMDCKNMGISLI